MLKSKISQQAGAFDYDCFSKFTALPVIVYTDRQSPKNNREVALITSKDHGLQGQKILGCGFGTKTRQRKIVFNNHHHSKFLAKILIPPSKKKNDCSTLS